MQNLAQRLEDYIHEKIILARSMQVAVREYRGDSLTLTAPLAANDNHKGTAFGGSQFALAALASWGLLMIKLWENDLDGEIVVQEGRIKYLAPVADDLVLVCRPADPKGLADFVRTYQRKEVARIELEAEIQSHGRRAMEFRGQFVAGV
jgi:thioesterase domain-containing protein